MKAQITQGTFKGKNDIYFHYRFTDTGSLILAVNAIQIRLICAINTTLYEQ